MNGLLIGSENGVAFVDSSWSAHDEAIREPVGFLAASARGVYGITRSGALLKRDAAGVWEEAHPHPVSDEVWSFAADSALDGRLYVGVSPALLHLSADGGRSWKACDAMARIPGYETWTFPPPPHVPHVRYVSPDPDAPGAVYIGVEEGGVYRSADDGETWESLNEGLYWDVHTVTPLLGSDRLYATTGNGFYRSDDGGHTWTHQMRGLDRSYTLAVAVAPDHRDRVFAMAAATPPPGWRRNGTANAALYRSEDGGLSWAQLTGGLPERFDSIVRVLRCDGALVLALTEAELWVSEDSGATWDRRLAGLSGAKALAIV